MVDVAVRSTCLLCNRRPPHPVVLRGGRVVHDVRGSTVECSNYDSECRHGAESLGFYTFAWLPKRCRNGRLRWLTLVERHQNGTYTLGNRAH